MTNAVKQSPVFSHSQSHSVLHGHKHPISALRVKKKPQGGLIRHLGSRDTPAPYFGAKRLYGRFNGF